MDQNDFEGIDEDDVAERVFQHSVLTFHVLSLLIVEIIFAVSQLWASILFPNEALLFPACALFAIKFGNFISKQYLSRYFQVPQADFEFLGTVLDTISTTIAVCMLGLLPEDSGTFLSILFFMVFDMIVVTFVLGLSLLVIFM